MTKSGDRAAYLLLASVILLNLAVRYPLTPHEIGLDGYSIHGLAVSTIDRQRITWEAPAHDVFGLGPYNYAAAVPVLLATISFSTGLSVEQSTFLLSLISAIVGTLAAATLGSRMFGSKPVAIFFALIVSMAIGYVNFTTWTASTRGLFLSMFLLPIALLYPSSHDRPSLSVKLRVGLSAFLILILSMTHQLVFLLPIFLLPLFLTRFSGVAGQSISHRGRYRILIVGMGLAIVAEGGILVFLLDYVPGLAISDPLSDLALYVALYFIFISLRTGPASILAIPGVLLFLFDNDRKRIVFLFGLAAMVIPSIFIREYSSLMAVYVICLFSAEGFRTLKARARTARRRALFLGSIAAISALTVLAASLSQVYTSDFRPQTSDRYLSEEGFETAIYILHETSGAFESSDSTLGWRIGGITNRPTLIYDDHANSLATGLITEERIETFVAPVERWATYGILLPRGYELRDARATLLRGVVTQATSQSIVAAYDINAVVIYHPDRVNNAKGFPFFESVSAERYAAYSNAHHDVYLL